MFTDTTAGVVGLCVG